jgi:ADP-L-glycero-D-manno-heptose 6-epimerase
MKILVTGHKGFIGQNLYKDLQNFCKVDGFEWGEEFPGFDYDWIIHLGAITSTTETDVEKIMTQNYDFSIWLLENSNRYKVNLQFSSTASIYGQGNRFDEHAPPKPLTPYSWSKYLFERYVKQKDWDIIVQCFRYFNVHGPGEDHKNNQASPQHRFRKQVEERGYIELFEGSENFYRDFVPVETVINIHRQFLTIDQSGIWNIGSGQPKSFLEVAKEISDNYKFIPMPENLKTSYQSYTCADMTKTNRTLKLI